MIVMDCPCGVELPLLESGIVATISQSPCSLYKHHGNSSFTWRCTECGSTERSGPDVKLDPIQARAEDGKWIIKHQFCSLKE